MVRKDELLCNPSVNGILFSEIPFETGFHGNSTNSLVFLAKSLQSKCYHVAFNGLLNFHPSKAIHCCSGINDIKPIFNRLLKIFISFSFMRVKYQFTLLLSVETTALLCNRSSSLIFHLLSN